MKQHTPYMRATDFATGTKAYDHEDVATDFHADSTLSIIANTLASFGIFAALMCVIAVLAQFPESLGSWIVLSVWGV